MILIVEGKAFKLESADGKTVSREEVLVLASNQEETDSRVAMYAAYGALNGYKTVRVKSPDSDVFFILLHHAHNLDTAIEFDTGTGNSKRLIDITRLANAYGPKKSTALMSLHAFTGCDTCSSFKGIGKVKPIKILEKKSEFEDFLAELGSDWILSEEVSKSLEKLTCYFYRKTRFSSLDALRLHLLKKRCNSDGRLDPKRTVDLGSLPPCSSTLKQHLKRTNLQIGIWKRGMDNFQEIPRVEEHGWVRGDKFLEPLWCDGDVLPPEIGSLLDSLVESDSEELEVEQDTDDFDSSEEEY